MTVLKAYRLPVELVKKLSLLSKSTKRSETFYVAEAISHYLTEYADAQIAMDRFNDPKAKIISGKELRSKLGI
jgi:predicted DNA-binding protein